MRVNRIIRPDWKGRQGTIFLFVYWRLRFGQALAGTTSNSCPPSAKKGSDPFTGPRRFHRCDRPRHHRRQPGQSHAGNSQTLLSGGSIDATAVNQLTEFPQEFYYTCIIEL
jgi:hypothetical protein